MNVTVVDPLAYLSLQDTKETINAMQKRFLTLYNIQACSLGFEYEFYCLQSPTKNFLVDVCNIDGVHELKQELGNLQFEVTTQPFQSFVEACNVMYWVKKSIQSLATKHGVPVSFNAVAFEHVSPPSSMQASICLYGKNNDILTSKCKQFNQAVQSLVHNLYETTLLTCPTPNCYTRLAGINIAKQFKNSPTHITWGVENRTLAVRIASVPGQQLGNRIEYRTPSPMANPYYVAIALLVSMLSIASISYPQTFVDSWESSSQRLPHSISEAYTAFIKCQFINMIHTFSYQHAI